MTVVVERIDSGGFNDLNVLLKEFQKEMSGLAGYPDFEPDSELNSQKESEFLDMPDYGVFMAKTVKGHLLGFCLVFPMPVGIREERYAVLDRIYVRPDFRRRQIGHELLDQAKRFARSCKCQRLQLTMSAFFPLDGAEAFFDAEKFYRTGGRKHKIALS